MRGGLKLRRGLNENLRRFRCWFGSVFSHRSKDLKTTPRTGDIKKLAGREGGYRLRVGDYRVFYTLSKDDLTIYVEGVRHRSSAYER